MEKRQYKEFEESVYALLRAIGYKTQKETLLGSKRIDLYFEIKSIVSTQRIAVECKHYTNNLQKNDIESIFSTYITLKQNNLIDQVLIITVNGISPAGSAYIRETNNFLSHLTFEELQAQIIDFDFYVKGLVANYIEEPIAQYYVPMNPVYSRDEVIEEFILNEWIYEKSAKQLAILGSYGLGKTTLATRLGYEFGKRVVEIDPTHRIPIIIRLGEIASEQSLEGLLGKLFTANTVVRNYTYEAFMNLNRAGRFVIILDGFDEMKHTLNWENFRYNFEQLNRLNKGDAKIILLGRPTAFLSDEEHQYILHGESKYAQRKLNVENNSDYDEIEIAYFNKEQIKEFLTLYLNYILANEKAINKKEFDKEKKHLESVLKDKNIYDIAKRPVQLKMLIEVLPTLKGKISDLNITLLYSEFIDLIIDREYKKFSRLRYNKLQRRRFSRDIGWWLWINNDKFVSASKIPDELLESYKRDKDDDIDAIRRDLVTACFLERKMGESLYFPHRSFQEFLVAEELGIRLKSSRITIDQVIDVSNPEIYLFLQEMTGLNDLYSFHNCISRFKGSMPIKLANIWSKSNSYCEFILSKCDQEEVGWYFIFLTIGFIEGTFNINKKLVYNLLKRKIWHRQNDSLYNYVLLLCGCIIFNDNGDNTELRNIFTTFLNYDHPRAEKQINRVWSSLTFQKQTKTIYFDEFYKNIQYDLSNYCAIREWQVNKTIRLEKHSLPHKVVFDNASEFNKLMNLSLKRK